MKCKQGYQVMSPHVLPEGFPWGAYMPLCYAMMDACDTIYMLPGWQESKGATLEHERAKVRGMNVIYGLTDAEKDGQIRRAARGF